MKPLPTFYPEQKDSANSTFIISCILILRQIQKCGTQSREGQSSKNTKFIYLEEVLWGKYGSPHPRVKIFPAGLGFFLKALLLPFTSTKRTKKCSHRCCQTLKSSGLVLISTLAGGTFLGDHL